MAHSSDSDATCDSKRALTAGYASIGCTLVALIAIMALGISDGFDSGSLLMAASMLPILGALILIVQRNKRKETGQKKS